MVKFFPRNIFLKHLKLLFECQYLNQLLLQIQFLINECLTRFLKEFIFIFWCYLKIQNIQLDRYIQFYDQELLRFFPLIHCTQKFLWVLFLFLLHLITLLNLFFSFLPLLFFYHLNILLFISLNHYKAWELNLLLLIFFPFQKDGQDVNLNQVIQILLQSIKQGFHLYIQYFSILCNLQKQFQFFLPFVLYKHQYLWSILILKIQGFCWQYRKHKGGKQHQLCYKLPLFLFNHI